MIPRSAIVLTTSLGFVFASASLPPMASVASAKNDDTKRQCIASAETAQNLRLSNKPLAARAALRECVRDVCPRVVRSRCAHWLEENESAIPTVVLNARDASGADVVDVVVTVDGKPLTRTLDGGALALEPGEHSFEYARPGGATVRTRVLLGTGEKNRLVSVTLGDASASSSSAVIDSDDAHDAHDASGLGASSTSGSRASSSPSRTGAWVFAGLSVVAVGSFAYFGVTGESELSDLRTKCAGHCDESVARPTWNKLIVADVSLGIAVVSAGIATYLFLRKPTETGGVQSALQSSVPSALLSGIQVSPSTRGRGASVGWSASF